MWNSTFQSIFVYLLTADIELRRSSGGFETTKCVSSVMSETGDDDAGQEPQAKKPRLECLHSDLDLSLSNSSNSSGVEEPSQSVTREEAGGEVGQSICCEEGGEEGVGSTEGIVSGSQDTEMVTAMSSSSDVEHSSSSTSNSTGGQETPPTISDTLVQSSDSSNPTVVKCNSSSSQGQTEACSQSTDSLGEAAHTDTHTDSQCDSASGGLTDSVTYPNQQQPQHQQPPDSAGPEPMDTD